MMFERHVVMVGRDDCLPADVRPQSPRQHSANLFCYRPPRCVGKAPGAGGIVKIFGACVGLGVEHAEPVIYWLRTCKMVGVDRLAKRP